MLSRPHLLLLLLLALPATAVEQLGYRVLDSKPTSRGNFVQGLEIIDGLLYVSTGLYGQSRLMRYDFASGELLQQRRLNARLFAEGVTVLDDKIYQLTWRNRMLLEWQVHDLTFQRWYPLPGEGWGLTNNGEQLIYSDGSDRLHFVTLPDMRITRSLRVTEDGKPLRKLNELEWIEGKIWANIWQSHRIVTIDPGSGEVVASIDLQGILPVNQRRADTDVLNGIARDPATGYIWVTGKRWPSLFRIETVPLAESPNAAETR